MTLGVLAVRSMIVEGLWPVMDFGVPPRGLAEVRMSGPVSGSISINSGWLGMRMPIVSKWS